MNFNNLRHFHYVFFAQLVAIYLAATQLHPWFLVGILVLVTIERLHMHVKAQKVTIAYALEREQWKQFMGGGQ